MKADTPLLNDFKILIVTTETGKGENQELLKLAGQAQPFGGPLTPLSSWVHPVASGIILDSDGLSCSPPSANHYYQGLWAR